MGQFRSQRQITIRNKFIIIIILNFPFSFSPLSLSSNVAIMYLGDVLCQETVSQ